MDTYYLIGIVVALFFVGIFFMAEIRCLGMMKNNNLIRKISYTLLYLYIVGLFLCTCVYIFSYDASYVFLVENIIIIGKCIYIFLLLLIIELIFFMIYREWKATVGLVIRSLIYIGFLLIFL
ncbi:TPA: hypothetical protein I9092_000907 [Clostridium perfringens]|uniref:hypothetical protein n=1 Tax=Clostridium perfringens TaxID=1502 RepID=UPI001A35B4F4|nr:hypothetical protein [Clostridium perfringens]HAT4354695.1 hypothetical protein [Clostridium perfringens]